VGETAAKNLSQKPQLRIAEAAPRGLFSFLSAALRIFQEISGAL
jgi:hypothetical protein